MSLYQNVKIHVQFSPKFRSENWLYLLGLIRRVKLCHFTDRYRTVNYSFSSVYAKNRRKWAISADFRRSESIFSRIEYSYITFSMGLFGYFYLKREICTNLIGIW